MGLDVPKTNLVVVNSCPPSAWEFSQQVLFGNVVFFLSIFGDFYPHESYLPWLFSKFVSSVWARGKERW